MEPSYVALKDEHSKSQWGVHWYTPFFIVSTFILGIVFAVSNDLLYRHYTDMSSSNLQWAIRFGTILAFASKTSFTACVGISYRQSKEPRLLSWSRLSNLVLRLNILGIWRTLRDKSISIGGIDALFGATVDPYSFLSFEMISNSKLSTLMAALSWLLPISAILSPTTLSVGLNTFGPFPIDTQVPQLNLTGWDASNSFAGSLVSFVDTHMSYNQFTPVMQALAAQALYGGKILEFPGPVGCGANCTYEIEFYGPALSCKKLNSSYDKIGDFEVVRNPSRLPGGYSAVLEPVSKNSSDGRLGLAKRLRIKAFSTAPTNYSSEILCTPYNATYSVNITFTNDLAALNIQKLELLWPIDESAKDANAQLYPGASPYVVSGWPARAIIDSLYSILLGNITFDRRYEYMTVDKTTISNTLLAAVKPPAVLNGINPWSLEFVDNLDLAVEQLSHNLTLSLLSASPAKISRTVHYTITSLVCKYQRMTLLLIYLASTAAALFSLVVGLLALRSNGISSDVSFSRALVTTRNPVLDHLTYGASLGGGPFPKHLRKTKLRFGEISSAGSAMGVGVAHAGFGTDNVAPLRKGDKYL